MHNAVRRKVAVAPYKGRENPSYKSRPDSRLLQVH
jgi:hypothetical protein